MANIRFYYLLAVSAVLLVTGCCGPTGSSSSCTLGTYGEACTEFCDKSAGTQFDSGPNCFTECTGLVRQQGLGDATTCCKESISQDCQSTCTSQLSQMISAYGSIDQAEKDDFVSGCMAECEGAYQQLGIPLSSCSAIDTEILINSMG